MGSFGGVTSQPLPVAPQLTPFTLPIGNITSVPGPQALHIPRVCCWSGLLLADHWRAVELVYGQDAAGYKARPNKAPRYRM